jgi:hypothetical protein
LWRKKWPRQPRQRLGWKNTNRNGKFHNGVEWRKLSLEIIQQIRDARAAGKAAGGAPKQNVASVIAEPVEDATGPLDKEQQGAVSNGPRFGSGA